MIPVHGDMSSQDVVLYYPNMTLHCMIFIRSILHASKRMWNEQISNTFWTAHYIDVIMSTMAYQITSITVVYSTVCSDADQRKHQSSASLAFVWGIHRDRWIPRTKGQLSGKSFHLMTSSCFSSGVGGLADLWFQTSLNPNVTVICLIAYMGLSIGQKVVKSGTSGVRTVLRSKYYQWKCLEL